MCRDYRKVCTRVKGSLLKELHLSREFKEMTVKQALAGAFDAPTGAKGIVRAVGQERITGAELVVDGVW